MNSGMKWVLTIGLAAWGIRFGFFAAARPFWLVMLGVALHGVCFDFFFGAGFIHVANIAPKGGAATAQGLFGVITYGLGMYVGTIVAGWLNQYLTRDAVDPATGASERVTDWRNFWGIPAVVLLVSVVLFVALFPSSVGRAAPNPSELAPAAEAEAP